MATFGFLETSDENIVVMEKRKKAFRDPKKAVTVPLHDRSRRAWARMDTHTEEDESDDRWLRRRREQFWPA